MNIQTAYYTATVPISQIHFAQQQKKITHFLPMLFHFLYFIYLSLLFPRSVAPNLIISFYGTSVQKQGTNTHPYTFSSFLCQATFIKQLKPSFHFHFQKGCSLLSPFFLSSLFSFASFCLFRQYRHFVAGSLPHLYADSALRLPPWQPSNCLKELILDTGSRRHTVIEVGSGMGHRQEDVEQSSCPSGNSGRSSFHLFVCSQAVFAPVKTKFNLHPFIHCYSVLSASASPQPKPLSSSLLPSLRLFLFLTHILQPFVFLTISVKNIFQFHFAGLRLWFF